PEGPVNAMSSPSATARSTSDKTRCFTASPRSRETPRASRTVVTSPHPGRGARDGSSPRASKLVAHELDFVGAPHLGRPCVHPRAVAEPRGIADDDLGALGEPLDLG